jgi:hypothetical protein
MCPGFIRLSSGGKYWTYRGGPVAQVAHDLDISAQCIYIRRNSS